MIIEIDNEKKLWGESISVFWDRDMICFKSYGEEEGHFCYISKKSGESFLEDFKELLEEPSEE